MMAHYSKRHSAFQKIAAVLLSLLTAVSVSSPVFAADGTAEQTINVGMFLGEGYAVQDEDGNWSGIDIEITENIAQTAGFQVRFVEEDSTDQAFQDLESGKIDMLADIAKTDERERRFLFSEYEQGSVGTNIFVRDDDERWDYENTDQLKKMKFSCEKDNIAETDFRNWCRQYGFEPDIVFYGSVAEAAEAVKEGQADAYIDGEDNVEGFRSVLSFAPSSYYYIFAQGSRALKMQVDAALGQIYIQDPLYSKELMEKYLGLAQKKYAILSEKEKQYVSYSPAVRVAVLSDDEPYFRGTPDSPAGIIPEFYNQIASATGLSFVYQVYETQEAAIDAVKSGKADLVGMFSSGITQAYDQGLIITRKYTTVSTVMITETGTDDDSISSIAVKDRSRATILQGLPEKMQDAELIACNTADECFAALTDKRADAVIIGLPSATYLVNQRNSSAYVITPVSSVNLALCAAAEHGNNTLVSVINKGINSVSYTMNGIVANNTAARDNLRTAIAKIPAAAIVIFACVMIFLVLMLFWAVVALARSRRSKVAAVKAEAVAREQRIKAEAFEKSAEEKNAFFANISHDMRTPLNAIAGFIRMAGKDGLEPQMRNEYLEKAGQASDLLLSLVDDTLTMSKAGSGKLQLYPEPVNNYELFDSIIVPIRETAARKNITFTADYSEVSQRMILADRLNVQKIFLNLLSNAVKYTPPGGHVNLYAGNTRGENDSLESVLIVSDDGIGISEEFMPEIFEPFTQEKRHGYESVGTGLGLSIVKQLVELMNGTIEVKSEKEHGTTVTVRLHFADAAVAESDAPEAEQVIGLAGRKVLLCEDNALNREIAISMLKEKGMSVVAAEDGSEGVRIFSESAEGEFDVILMDLRMPVMDGFEATHKIRALERGDAAGVPIIAMTADAFEDDVRKCLAAGMNAHVAKPIDPENLYRTLAAGIAAAEKA